MKTIKLNSGSQATAHGIESGHVVLTSPDSRHDSRNRLILEPREAVELGLALIEQARETCPHTKTNSVFMSDGPVTFCEDCNKQTD